MEFGIKNLVNGWFQWYVQDSMQKVEITASRYDNIDFVKKLLVNLTDIIQYRKENIVSFFSEPGCATIKMKVEDNDMFTMEYACGDRAISLSEDITQADKYYKFSVSMFCMRSEFVPSILNSFQYFQKNQINLDYYNENWSEAIGLQNNDKFSYPFIELQELHRTASAMVLI